MGYFILFSIMNPCLIVLQVSNSQVHLLEAAVLLLHTLEGVVVVDGQDSLRGAVKIEKKCGIFPH